MKTVLWLDDHFDEQGELDATGIYLDTELAVDVINLSRAIPGLKLVSETSLRGFLQRLINRARSETGLPQRGSRTGEFDAMIVDIMIEGVEEFQVPRVSAADRAICFDSIGNFVAMDVFRCEAYDVGVVIVREFIRKVSAFDKIPIIFYTHRAINAELQGQIAEIANTDLVYAVSKSSGLSALRDKLKGAGL